MATVSDNDITTTVVEGLPAAASNTGGMDDVFGNSDPKPDHAPNASSDATSVELTSFSTSTGERTTESSVSFVITDETNSNWQRSRYNHVLPLSTDVDSLYNAVAADAGYVPGTFSLVWRCQNGTDGEEEVPLAQHSTATLYELGMKEEPTRTYLLIREKDEKPPEKVQDQFSTEREHSTGQVSTHISNASSSSVGSSSNWSSYSNPIYNSSSNNYSSTSTSGYGYTSYNYNAKSETGFVGLVNQAMTCYLNSLLQTLYMTPEFRNAIYEWKFEPRADKEDSAVNEAMKCIPYQLQRLFLQLQTAKKRAIETTDVTKSFGWDSSEAWQQHDVQELCRVMFDALEKRFKKDQGLQQDCRVNLINELYQGKCKDYVKCKKCGHESARADTFLDIPLVIKPFGSSVAFGSVEEALDDFVKAETLDGDNQYFCEKCNEKQDALKGLKFKQFPYLLTLQLKRFDFDYTTMHRIKLNDRMTFPKVLNLNHFIDDDEEKPSVPNDVAEQYKDFIVERFDRPDLPPSYSSVVSSSAAHLPSYSQATGREDPELEESSEVKAEKEDVKQNKIVEMLSEGPYVYELFSIMIHSGSAIGGHYYAYIKSLKDKRWYCFNDQSVSRITQEEIEQTFGGTERTTSRGYYSSMYSYSANAYMLMYRRVDIESNAAFLVEDCFPAHLKQQIEDDKMRELEETRKKEMEKQMCKFKLFCNHPVTGKIVESKLEVNQNSLLPDALAEAYKVMNLSKHIPIEQCRLVKYDDYAETMDQSFDLDEFGSQTFGQLVGGARNYYSFEIFLETRQADEVFQKYNKGGMKLKIQVIDLETGEVHLPVSMRAEQGWSVSELKEHIGKMFNMDPTCMNLVLEVYNDGRHLSNDGVSLKGEGLYRKHTLFAASDPEDYNRHYRESCMYKFVESHVNSILLNITLPPFQEEEEKEKEKESRATDEQEGNQKEEASNADIDNKGSSNGEGNGDTQNQDGGTLESEAAVSSSNNDGEEKMNDQISNETLSNGEVIVHDEPLNGGEKGEEEEVMNDKVSQKDSEKEEVKFKNTTAGAPGLKIISLTEEEKGKKRDIQIRVDRRTTLAQLKDKLSPIIGVPPTKFKVYRVYNNQQEYEMERLNDSLMSTPSESRFVVRLGRALQIGEHRIKLYLLHINNTEFFNLMMESIVAKNTPISEFKKQIIQEAKIQGVDCVFELDKMRLRKKTWRSPGTVYLDTQWIDRDIHVYAGSEMYVEPLEAPEQMKVPTQMQLYVRRWRPSLYEVEPTKEVILDTASVTDLKKKLSELSGIHPEDVSIAKGVGSFPAEISSLEVENELDWDPPISSINQSPFTLYDDGNVIYYKDRTETLKELTTEERNEIQKTENSRVSKVGIYGTGSSSSGHSTTNYYYRKERALKIYTDDDKPEKEREV